MIVQRDQPHCNYGFIVIVATLLRLYLNQTESHPWESTKFPSRQAYPQPFPCSSQLHAASIANATTAHRVGMNLFRLG